jgi:hypothetical protein
MSTRVASLALALLCATSAASASIASLAECGEAADFIANAARARDNGMAGGDFLTRLDDDLVVIRSFPPALRWFARDADDEAFLRQFVTRVFSQPRDPLQHRAEFLGACLERSAA